MLFVLICVLSFSEVGSTANEGVPIDEILELAGTSIDEAISLAGKYGQDPYDFGMAICVTRPKDAINWFLLLTRKQGEKPEYIFGLAWAYWTKHDLVNAQKQAVFLLSSSKEENTTQGRARYLLGIIYLQQAILGPAEKELNRSLEIFKKCKQNGGVFTCLLGLADVAYLGNHLSKSESILIEAAKINATRKDPDSGKSWLEFHWGAISLRKGQYANASEHFKKALLDKNPESFQMTSMARTNLSLCSALLGNLDVAISYAREVDKFTESSQEHGFVTTYNNIAWHLIYRCQGVDVSNLEVEISQWVSDGPGSIELSNLFSVVKQLKCANGSGKATSVNQ